MSKIMRMLIAVLAVCSLVAFSTPEASAKTGKTSSSSKSKSSDDEDSDSKSKSGDDGGDRGLVGTVTDTVGGLLG